MFLDRRRMIPVPLYEYKCAKCGHEFEKIESYSAPETRKCPKCAGKAKRQISSSSVQFKGSGWYVTDYGSKKTAGGDGAKREHPASAESKTDAKSDSKGDSKGDSKSDSKPSKSAESKASPSKPASSSSSAEKK
jgi:putative FmdB family regulatory protein